MTEPKAVAIPRPGTVTITQILDPAAIAIQRGSVLLGLIAAVHRVLRGLATAGPSGLALTVEIIDAGWWLLAYVLFGIVASRILMALGLWLTGREAIVRAGASSPPPVAGAPEVPRDEPARSTPEPSGAPTAVDELALDSPASVHLSELQEELDSEMNSARENQLAQLAAAREVNDPERVLELHAALSPSLETEKRRELDAELSKWLLRLVHHRLRTGKIQVDLVLMAGRIAETFAHTHDGASLRASLPTLRRSAGLCPRCARPFTGLAAACPECLRQPVQPVRLTDGESAESSADPISKEPGDG